MAGLRNIGLEKLDHYQGRKNVYQTPIRNGFRKKIFSRRDLEPEDMKLADISFCSSIGSVWGQEENTIDVTLSVNDYQEIEGLGVKEKGNIVFTRKRMESLSSEFIFNENIVNKNFVMKEVTKLII